MTEQPKERTLVRVGVMFPNHRQAAAIQRELRGVFADWGWEWHEAAYDRERQVWQVTGKIVLADLTDPGAELWDLAFHVWNCTEEYCDVCLILNPAEPGERAYAMDEEDYEDYEATLEELGVRVDQLRPHNIQDWDWAKREGKPGTHPRRRQKPARGKGGD